MCHLVSINDWLFLLCLVDRYIVFRKLFYYILKQIEQYFHNKVRNFPKHLINQVRYIYLYLIAVF